MMAMQMRVLPDELENVADAIIAGSHQPPGLSASQKSAWELPLKIVAENQDTILTLARCSKTAQDIVHTLAWAYELRDAPTVGRLETLVQRRIAQWIQEGDPELAPYATLVNYRDIRVVGDTCMTVTHYLSEYYVSIQKNHPADIEAERQRYLHLNQVLEREEYIVHSYGARWFRVWYGGRKRVVRKREEIARIRQEMANETFYIPEDYPVPQSQIDLAYDL